MRYKKNGPEKPRIDAKTAQDNCTIKSGRMTRNKFQPILECGKFALNFVRVFKEKRV
jgi:hypothetical protein